MSRQYYSAIIACKVCGVTARMLDYWTTTGVIEPVRVFECDRKGGATCRRKAYHLFDMPALVKIKIVKELREAGLSLQSIRFAIKRLQRQHGDMWQKAWIVTDGKRVYEQTDDSGVLASLAKGEKGQLVFLSSRWVLLWNGPRASWKPASRFSTSDIKVG